MQNMVSRKTVMKYVRFGVILLGFVFVLAVVQMTLLEDVEDDIEFEDLHGHVNPMVARASAESENIPHPIIMWWNGFTGEQGRTKQCGNVSCFFTIDRHYKHHQNMKAFVFYGTDYHPEDLPLPRLPSHEWAVFHEESPKNNYLFSHEETLELFNHTATFRRESDYPLTTQHLGTLSEIETKQYLISTEEKNRLMRKKGLAMVAFVQSDCGTPSDRDHFVKMLQRHIAVDSYGKCEHNRDLPEHLVDPIKGMDHEDFLHHMAQYKFVLAMENAVCDDYITEKFWRPFTVGNVPIVFGSPKSKEYTPDSHSAIFVEDFENIDDLVKLLKHLNSSSENYNKYLQYKENGVTNEKLKAEMARREWGVNDFNKPNFIDGFECLICQRINENLRRVKSGLDPLKHQADISHYGCPRPYKFSDKPKGSLKRVPAPEQYWSSEYEDTRFKAQAVKDLVNQGKVFSHNNLHQLASLKRKQYSARKYDM